METNWLELAKQITEPLKCAYCGNLIGRNWFSMRGGDLVDGEVINARPMCWLCAQQDAN